jgi:hypothetical protein
VLEHSLQRLGSIARLGDNVHVGFIFEQAPQPLPQQDVVVRQDAPNLLVAENSFSLDLCGGAHSCSSFN